MINFRNFLFNYHCVISNKSQSFQITLALTSCIFVFFSFNNIALSQTDGYYDPSDSIRALIDKSTDKSRFFSTQGLSIEVPKNWQIEFGNQKNSTQKMVLKRINRSKGKIKYQPNLVLYVEGSGKTIVDTHPDWFKKLLQKKYKNQVNHYKIKQIEMVDYDVNHPGIVAYSTSQLNGVKLHHMHFFVSSGSNSYFFNYSNIGQFKKTNQLFLEEAWQIIVNSKIESKPLYSDFKLAYSCGVIVTLLLLGLGYQLYSRHRQNALIQTYLVDDLEYWQPSKSSYVSGKPSYLKKKRKQKKSHFASQVSDPLYSDVSYENAFLG